MNLETAKQRFNRILRDLSAAPVAVSGRKAPRMSESTHPFAGTAWINPDTPAEKYRNFIALDTETTGLNPEECDIIEVSAVRFENCVPVEVFTTLLRPRKRISEEIVQINGITNEMVRDCPSFGEIEKSLRDYLGDYPIVAHNASFDIRFLHTSGLKFRENAVFYDTLALARKYIRTADGEKLPSYRLGCACEACGICFDGAHRSTADALAAGLLFTEIVKCAEASFAAAGTV